MSKLIDRVHRLHVNLQHLLVLIFPRNQEVYQKYLELCKRGVLSPKLQNHPVYSEKIIDHLDIPTIVVWYEDSKTKVFFKHWSKKGLSHREGDLPAFQSWYKNGEMKTQEWLKDGNFHRESTEGDLPAIQKWYSNGQLLNQEFWKDGRRHRDSGLPAIQKWDETGTLIRQEWWENGTKIKKENYN